jgi:uncharacterized BrkB/YihY/UPF0761 family membrane protein
MELKFFTLIFVSVICTILVFIDDFIKDISVSTTDMWDVLFKNIIIIFLMAIFMLVYQIYDHLKKE